MEHDALPPGFVQDILSAPGPFIKADGAKWRAEEIAGLFPPLGYFAAVIDGPRAPDKRSLLTELASAMKFPSYFGYNWDALLDCLRTLPEFAPAKGYALVISGSSRLLETSRAERENFEGVAADAAAFLDEKYKVPLKIILL